MSARLPAPTSERPLAAVVPLLRHADDQALLDALLAEDPQAPGIFFQRFAKHVERILTGILGASRDVSPLVNETFFRALERVDRVDEASGLKRWLTAIAALVAREHLRQERRRGWLHFFDFAAIPELEPEAPVGTPETKEAVHRLYGLLHRLPAEERVAFALRFIEGMELVEVARACSVSLATIKRLLARVESRFAAASRRDPVLREWLEGGTRWGHR